MFFDVEDGIFAKEGGLQMDVKALHSGNPEIPENGEERILASKTSKVANHVLYKCSLYVHDDERGCLQARPKA